MPIWQIHSKVSPIDGGARVKALRMMWSVDVVDLGLGTESNTNFGSSFYL